MENSEVIRRLGKLEQDMWFGNGKPGMTTRMVTVENGLESITQSIKITDERRAKKQDRIEILVWGALIAAIANLVFSHMK